MNSYVYNVNAYLRGKLLGQNLSDIAHELVRRGSVYAPSTLQTKLSQVSRLNATYQWVPNPAARPDQHKNILKELARLLGFLETPVIHEVITVLKAEHPGFVYPPQDFSPSESTQHALVTKIKSLRPEHRESLDRLADTYLARYEIEERADYQGSD